MKILQDLKNIISEIKGDDLACFLAKSKMENLLVSKIIYEFEKLHQGKIIGWKEFGIGDRQKIDLIFHSGEQEKHNESPRKVYAGLEFKQYLTHDAVDPFDNPKIRGFSIDRSYFNWWKRTQIISR